MCIYKSDKNAWKDDCYCKSEQNSWKDDEHKDNHKKEECCCKKSMREALELLSNTTLTSDAIFGPFGFIGDSYITGAFLRPIQENDNLGELSATFNGFEPCNCDVIRITSTNAVYYPIPVTGPITSAIAQLGSTVNRISLCDIEAIVFRYTLNSGITQARFENDLIALLDKIHEKCKFKCAECCCNNGILNTLSSANTVSLTAGWLAVENLRVLGRIGNVLVLINQLATSPSILGRVYFICLDSIGDMNV